MDNYNDSWRRNFAKIGENSYVEGNWTGVALRQARPDIDMSVSRINGQIIPAMPDNPLIFAEHAIQLILFGSVGTNNSNVHDVQKIPNLYDSSLLVAWAPINRVPLKPDPTNLNVPQQYRDAMAQSPDTLSNLHVVGIFPENIGSDEGLGSIIRQFYDAQCMADENCDRYFAMSADMNIHKRVLKVCVMHKI